MRALINLNNDYHYIDMQCSVYKAVFVQFQLNVHARRYVLNLTDVVDISVDETIGGLINNETEW